MKNADKTGSKTLGIIEFTEHTKNDVADRMKKAIEQRTISSEEDTKLLRDGKNAMPVNALNDFERHRSGTLDGIEISAGRAETAFAAKRNKFERTTRRTTIHMFRVNGETLMSSRDALAKRLKACSLCC